MVEAIWVRADGGCWADTMSMPLRLSNHVKKVFGHLFWIWGKKRFLVWILWNEEEQKIYLDEQEEASLHAVMAHGCWVWEALLNKLG